MSLAETVLIAVIVLSLAFVFFAAFAFVIYMAAKAFRSLGEPFENDEPDDKESRE